MAAIVAAVVGACSVGGAFDSDFKPVKVWHRSQPLEFRVPDTTAVDSYYDIELGVRHENYYAYRNLWILADYVSGGRVVETDTVSVTLSDEYGSWTGAGLGKLFQQSMPLKRHVAPGQYDKIVLWHYMVSDSVANLSDIGLIYKEE